MQSRTNSRRFTAVNMDERKQIETRGRDIRNFQLKRAEIEATPADVGKPGRSRENAQSIRMKMPASPIAARSGENVKGVRTPPPRPVEPKPQTAAGRSRQESPRKVDAKTEQKPVRRAPDTQTQPKRPETRPGTTREKPQRVAPGPERNKPESSIRQPKHKPEPVKRESNSVRTESTPRKPQTVETSRPEKVNGRPEANSRQPQAKSETRTIEPKRESHKPEASKQKSAPKEQAPQSVTERPKRTRKQPAGTEINKRKSRGKR